MAITRINNFEAAEGKGAELHAFLKSVVPLIQAAPGCQACRVLHNQDNARQFVVLETWDSVAAHQASMKSIAPEKLAEVKPLLAGAPSGAYYAE